MFIKCGTRKLIIILKYITWIVININCYLNTYTALTLTNYTGYRKDNTEISLNKSYIYKFTSLKCDFIVSKSHAACYSTQKSQKFIILARFVKIFFLISIIFLLNFHATITQLVLQASHIFYFYIALFSLFHLVLLLLVLLLLKLHFRRQIERDKGRWSQLFPEWLRAPSYGAQKFWLFWLL